MTTILLTRVGGVASILSALLWLTLTPLMATIGLCQGVCASWATQPLLVRTLGRVAAEEGWLSVAPPDTLYFAYGRYFFLVYVLLILGLIALDRAVYRSNTKSLLARRAYRLLLISFIVAALGDFTSYGIGVVSETAWRYGFGVEVLSWVGVILGSLLYGFALLCQKATHPIIGWLLILASFLVPATFFDRILVHYSPNAQLLPLVLLWPILGAYTLAQAR